MTKNQSQKIYPDSTLEHELVKRGCQVRCLWQIPGPKNTMIAWMEGILVQPPEGPGAVVIVQTYTQGGWEAFTANKSTDIQDTAEDVMARVSAT
jgi:hypothetical protein